MIDSWFTKQTTFGGAQMAQEYFFWVRSDRFGEHFFLSMDSIVGPQKGK